MIKVIPNVVDPNVVCVESGLFRVHPDSPGPRGNDSPAIVAGDFIFTSGQIPVDPATGELNTDGSIEEQTLLVLQNMRSVVEAAGGDLEDVVSVTVYLSDIGNWAAFNKVFGEFFHAPYPTRTVVGAEMKGFDVEATATPGGVVADKAAARNIHGADTMCSNPTTNSYGVANQRVGYNPPGLIVLELALRDDDVTGHIG